MASKDTPLNKHYLHVYYNIFYVKIKKMNVSDTNYDFKNNLTYSITS